MVAHRVQKLKSQPSGLVRPCAQARSNAGGYGTNGWLILVNQPDRFAVGLTTLVRLSQFDLSGSTNLSEIFGTMPIRKTASLRKPNHLATLIFRSGDRQRISGRFEKLFAAEDGQVK